MRSIKHVLLTLFIVSCGSSGKSTPDVGMTLPPDAGEGTVPDLAIDRNNFQPDSLTTEAGNKLEVGTYVGLPDRCGGNLVGTWLIEKIDLRGMLEALVGYSDKERLDACAPKFASTGSGTVVFRPDGTFTVSASMDMTFSMTTACVAKSYGYDCSEVKNCAPDNAGRCNCVGMPDGDKTVKHLLEGRYAAGHGTLMLIYREPDDGSVVPTSTIFVDTPVFDQSHFSIYCAKDGAIAISLGGLPGDVDYFPEISRTVMYGLRKNYVEGDAPEMPAFVEAEDSSKPVLAPKTIVPSTASDPDCKSSPVGKWLLKSLAAHTDLQDDVIREVREIYPDGECVSDIALSATGSVEFGPEGQNPNFASDESLTLAIHYEAACLAAKTRACDLVEASLKSQAEKLGRQAYACSAELNGDCLCERVQRTNVVSAFYSAGVNGSNSCAYSVSTGADAGADDVSFMGSYCATAKGLSIDLMLAVDGFSSSAFLNAVPVK